VRHDEVREALGRHLEGELGTTERRDVERHLAACAACRAEHDELRATVDLLRGLPDPEPPADLVPGVLRRLESAAPAPRRGFARGWSAVVRGAAPAVPIAALAAGLVLLVLAGLEELPLPGAGSAADLGARAPRVEVARARELAARRPSAPAAPAVRPLEPAPPAPARDERLAQAPTRAPRAPLAPSTVIDADALETVALDPARGPGRPRRRSGVPAGVGAAAAPAAETGTGLPPRPSLAACVGQASAPADEAAGQCRPWLQGMLTLAQYDPRGFLAEVEALPESEAAAWLAQLASFSRETRTSDGVASRLRSTPDARVGALARWFEPGPGEPAR
jgi:hypothetical protein